MGRARDPNRDKAFEIYSESNGNIELVEIAERLGVSAGTVRGWKSKDEWEPKINGTFQKKKTERSKKTRGAPKGSKNATKLLKNTTIVQAIDERMTELHEKNIMTAREEEGHDILSLHDYGYGTPGGCRGVNCGHIMTPFIPGVNNLPDLGLDVKNITPDQAMENANIQAKQRALERSIRRSKEYLHVAEKLGDQELIDKYKSKVRIQQGAMRGYLRQHPFLHRDYAREKYYADPFAQAKKEVELRRMASNKSYSSVKDDWLKDVDPAKAKLTDRDFWEHDGKKYHVDGHNVVLDYSQKEKETAQWLSQTFGKHVEMVPRVNYPKNINTPDYLFDGMKFDLKEISGSGKNIIDTSSKKAKKQAENIVFDITKTSLTEAEIFSQLEKVYKSGRRGLNISILKKSDELIDVLKPKEKE